MAHVGSASVARVFATELMNRGVAPTRAHELSGVVMASYPWARRIGVPRVAKELRAVGLDAEAARGFAETLFALELYDHGATLDEVLQHLREGSTDTGGTLSVALDAARIHRALRPRDPQPELPPGYGFALDLLGILAILVPVAIVLLSL